MIEDTDSDGDLVTNDTLKLTINFQSTTLIQGNVTWVIGLISKEVFDSFKSTKTQQQLFFEDFCHSP